MDTTTTTATPALPRMKRSEIAHGPSYASAFTDAMRHPITADQARAIAARHAGYCQAIGDLAAGEPVTVDTSAAMFHLVDHVADQHAGVEWLTHVEAEVCWLYAYVITELAR